MGAVKKKKPKVGQGKKKPAKKKVVPQSSSEIEGVDLDGFNAVAGMLEIACDEFNTVIGRESVQVHAKIAEADLEWFGPWEEIICGTLRDFLNCTPFQKLKQGVFVKPVFKENWHE